MRRALFGLLVIAVGACVEVPDSVRAQFAGPSANDRSNFRKGPHGTALPPEDPPASKEARPSPEATADGGTPVSNEPAADGGAS